MNTQIANQHTNEKNKNNKTGFRILSLLCFFLYLVSAVANAADFAGSLKGVTITDGSGANVPPTAEINYIKNGSTIDFDGKASATTNGSIVEYRWDFGDGTVGSGVAASHTFLVPGDYQVTLTVIDNQGGVSIAQTPISTKLFQIAVNFQPATSPVPEGYVADSNEPFNATKGYGWPVGLGTYALLDQNSSLSPNQAYDTMTTSTRINAYWELTVPENGQYLVTVCMGDPINSTGTMNAQVEGVPVITNEVLSTTKRWAERSATVDINDGKLTLTFTNTTPRVRLCWIKVEKK